MYLIQYKYGNWDLEKIRHVDEIAHDKTDRSFELR